MPVRLDGAVRNPDREGALAHLDLDRGFALVARASLSGIDVVDPAVWVREKLTIALAGADGEPPLRAILAAVRSLHGEIMKRPERDRTWISIGALLFHGDDGVAIAAGDAPCLRYRDGVLASLGRPAEESPAGAPRGSLGSETQVRIEVVPLRPRPGDVYLLVTRPLRDGELAILSRSLEGARTPGATLRAALEGPSDSARLAVHVLGPSEARTGLDAAPPLDAAPSPEIEEPAPLRIESLAPDVPAEDVVTEDVVSEAVASPEAAVEDVVAPDAAVEDLVPASPAVEEDSAPAFEAMPAADSVPPFVAPEPEVAPPAPSESDTIAARDEAPAPAETSDRDRDAVPDERAGSVPRRPKAKPALATVGEDRPWYEPLALWGGGALAIIALALLVKAIIPGITGQGGPSRGAKAPAAATSPSATVDILSDPPGAVVRLNGEPLAGRTPLTGIAVDPGLHRVELDWGAGGSWRDTIDVAAGAKLTLHPAIFGSLAFRSSDAGRVLDVYVDGAYSGTTPLSLDRVTVGRHLVRFGGPGLTMTAQEVDVLRDVHVELVGNAGPVPLPGKLTIQSAILGDEGFQPGKSDPVWIDGVARGATPFTASLTPGMHSVRVVRRDFPAQVTVIEVKPGNEHFVTAEFGARSGEPLRFTPPESLSRSQPTPLTISLPGDAGDAEHSVWLYAAAPGGSFQARAMTSLAEDARTYAALVPDEVLRNQGKQIRVYFKATARGGHEIYSEIFTIPTRD